MGCSTSKSSVSKLPPEDLTHEERQQRQNRDDGTDEHLSAEEAVTFANDDLDIPADIAHHVIHKILKNPDDETVSRAELTELWRLVNKYRAMFTSLFSSADPNSHGNVAHETAMPILQGHFKDIEPTYLDKLAKRFIPAGGVAVDYTHMADFYSRLKARKSAVGEKINSSAELHQASLKNMLMELCVYDETMATCICEDFDVDCSIPQIDKTKLLILLDQICT